MPQIVPIANITPHTDNLFLFWGGPVPSPDRLTQIRVCIRSVQRYAPLARVHLFSNSISLQDIGASNCRLVRWELSELVGGSPLAGRCPIPDGDWMYWSDLFRVVCLWRWGGSYMDVDDLLVRPLNAPTNAMAACFLTRDQAVRWDPAPTLSGNHAASTGQLPLTTPFRLGNDPMLNFSPWNPFLEAWLDQISHTSVSEWGQVLPTAIFGSDPERWRRHVNAVPWSDLLYHPYDGGHHPGDQRYPGRRLHSDGTIYRSEFLRCWPKLWGAFDFFLLKNHAWQCHRAEQPKQSLLHWAIQQAWSANGEAYPAPFGLDRSIQTGMESGCPEPPTINGACSTPVSSGRIRKLVLNCPLPPGDIVVLTAAVRDLHRRYPGQFLTDVRTNHPQIWSHNPHITALADHDPEVERIHCHYPLISHSNQLPNHFLEGFIDDLNQKLGLAIRLTEFRGDIHLPPPERTQPTLLEECFGYKGRYWLIAAGGKSDFTIKWWDSRRYQQVVNHFRDRIQFVQIGGTGDFHPELDGVLDLRGRTDLRQLIQLVYHAEGVVCPVTLLMHLAAAVPSAAGNRLRPCVVVAGGREPVHWEAYPGHQFLHTIGLLACCANGGCWRARTKALRDGSHYNHERFLCTDVVNSLPRCMDMITVGDVVRKVDLTLAVAPPSPVHDCTEKTPDPTTPCTPALMIGEPKVIPEDLLIQHFAALRSVPKPSLREQLDEYALTNTSLALGDTVILTTLPAVAALQGTQRYVDSDSPHFQALMRFNRHYLPAQGRVRAPIGQLDARYNLGNGHLTQKIQRAFGLQPLDRPSGYLDIAPQPVPGRVALHFEAGTHALWQRTHVHPRARQLYPESRSIIQEFIRQHPGWSFLQFGKKAAPFDGVADATGLPLDRTIALLASCEYFIGIVSGPMHLATALGLRCVIILNFPRASEIMLPTLKHTGVVESEWLYPQNVHLHQEDSAPLVPRLSLRNLHRAVQGELYPFWSDRFLPLIHERVPEP